MITEIVLFRLPKGMSRADAIVPRRGPGLRGVVADDLGDPPVNGTGGDVEAFRHLADREESADTAESSRFRIAVECSQDALGSFSHLWPVQT